MWYSHNFIIVIARCVNDFILELFSNFHALCESMHDFFIHCRNHHSGSHVNHVIILPHCEGNTLVSKVELWWFLHCYPEQTIELTMIWDAMILMLHHDNGMCRAQFQKRSDHCEKVIGSLISCQLTISRSDRIPRTILLPSDHDPGDPARYMDRCWIRNFITTINHFFSNITIVKFYKLPGTIYWNMVCLMSTGFIFSMTLITYTYLSNMACPNLIVSWANTVCMHWTGHDALVSALINDVATPPIATSWIDIISLTFFIQSQSRNFNSKFPSEWFMSWFNWQ